MPVIRTYPTLTLVDLERPRPEDIHIEDIAHSLSMQCRYAGHCSDFYSVAEHSFWVEKLAREKWMLTPEESLAFFLHDAQEAYLHDLTSPLKSLLPAYRALEERWVGFMHQRFGLSVDQPLACVGGRDPELCLVRVVDHFDKFVRECEQFTLCWAPDHLFSPEARRLEVECWSPAEARRRFLHRFHVLDDARGVR
jgi:uncharacterized protein